MLNDFVRPILSLFREVPGIYLTTYLWIFACALAGVASSHVPRLRAPVGIIITGVLCSVFLGWDFLVGTAITGSVVYAYIAIFLRDESTEGPGFTFRKMATLGMVLLALVFVTGRAATYDRFPTSDYPFYTFRIWQNLRLFCLLWEIGSGQVMSMSFTSFFAWYLFPFTLQGPLARYSEVEKRVAVLKGESPGAFFLNWRLLAKGLVQFTVGLMLNSVVEDWSVTNPAGQTLLSYKLVRWFALYPWSVYFRYAGIFSCMEAISPCWGITLLRSFDSPLTRRNISLFWANFNRTAVQAFQDIFFFNRWGFRDLNLYRNTMITFLAVGLWHSLDPWWLLWGAIHGMALCVFYFYRQNLFPKIPRRYTDSRIYVGIAVALTYVFVCLSYILPTKIVKMFAGG